ncbi:hypothetical protein C8J56DRAFT_895443 [Mycena floridula]|nr:hypothetical protein C8J56DRAFT_895443 [Mycena floridula]
MSQTRHLTGALLSQDATVHLVGRTSETRFFGSAYSGRVDNTRANATTNEIQSSIDESFSYHLVLRSGGIRGREEYIRDQDQIVALGQGDRLGRKTVWYSSKLQTLRSICNRGNYFQVLRGEDLETEYSGIHREDPGRVDAFEEEVLRSEFLSRLPNMTRESRSMSLAALYHCAVGDIPGQRALRPNDAVREEYPSLTAAPLPRKLGGSPSRGSLGWAR